MEANNDTAIHFELYVEDLYARLAAETKRREEAERLAKHLTESMRLMASGTQTLVFLGGRGCLTDDCAHWDDNTCNPKDPYCRIGRTVDVKEKT